jgi:DNA-binding helix-turn-helix protein
MDNIAKMKYHRIMYLLYKLYNEGVIAEVDEEICDLNILAKQLIDANYSLNTNLKYSTIALKMIREIEDLTIDEFAKKCGFSKQFISQIENETRPISKNLIKKIQIIFEWDLSIIYKGENQNG